ncbi:MAG: sigma-54 dependent transcriptional regulator [Thermodesulfovibrionales bacterium]|nr:sigma-54 dependent transcriptional regulator [Thermodesulfovibrionales bacterium]
MSDTKTLITFIGRQDPLNKDGKEGPLLTLLSKHDESFAQIILLHTSEEEFIRKADATIGMIQKRFHDININKLRLEISDPTDHVDVFKKLKGLIGKIKEFSKSNNLYISLTSGTPQMHIAVFLLVASGELSATMLYMPDPREQMSVVRKIIPWDGEIPEILPRIPRGAITYAVEEDIMKAKEDLGIIGNSESLNNAVKKALQYAPFDYTVMIRGSTGTGKESIAKLIHKHSKRKDKPFFAFNCAAITETIAESELFGHKKGAFTGAIYDKKGYFSSANGGTLFLDEVGELPLSIQAKLLRVLETGDIYPVGSTTSEKVDVRIICATHRNLEQMVKDGTFREDLFYRLNVLMIELPSLKDRKSDIPELAKYFLRQFCEKNQITKSFTDEALKRLCKHHWSGNVRELMTFIWRLAIDRPNETIDYTDIQLPDERYQLIVDSLPNEPFEGFKLDDTINKLRDYYYEKAIEITGNNKSKASKLLGVSPQAVDKWSKKE